MATESKGQVRYCIRCDQSGTAGMCRLIVARSVEDGVATDDDEMETWVHYDCLGVHRAKVLAEGLGAIGRYTQQEGDERCRGLLQQLADDLAASGDTPKT